MAVFATSGGRHLLGGQVVSDGAKVLPVVTLCHVPGANLGVKSAWASELDPLALLDCQGVP